MRWPFQRRQADVAAETPELDQLIAAAIRARSYIERIEWTRSALRWIDVPLTDSVLGAVAGYLSLWLVYWGFKLATGKEGMGYGDFKLFAALGAWFGWSALIPIILMASVIGALVGLAMKFASSLREGKYVPFGPFLAGAGLVVMMTGPQPIMQFVFSLLAF